MRTVIGLGLALIREQIQALREWHSALAGTRVAIAYGGVSTEDRFYLTRSPASQLSITALTKEMGSLGLRATVLDPCQPSFLRSLLDFDVVVPNMHGPYGEDGRLQGMLDYSRISSQQLAWPGSATATFSWRSCTRPSAGSRMTSRCRSLPPPT
jgi:hypothetical protein